MTTVTMPASHYTWQLLRILVRNGNRPLTGRELRHTPSRPTKDGTFLDELVADGLLEAAGPPADGKDAEPAQFRTPYRLTDKGLKAADYGEYEKTLGRPEPRVYVAVSSGVYGNWGRGETPDEAIENMRKHGSVKGEAARYYKVYRCHPDTRVCDDGALAFPTGHRPVVVVEVVPNVKTRRAKA